MTAGGLKQWHSDWLIPTRGFFNSAAFATPALAAAITAINGQRVLQFFPKRLYLFANIRAQLFGIFGKLITTRAKLILNLLFFFCGCGAELGGEFLLKFVLLETQGVEFIQGLFQRIRQLHVFRQSANPGDFQVFRIILAIPGTLSAPRSGHCDQAAGQGGRQKRGYVNKMLHSACFT